jgi:invasion protein IalB
MVEIMRAALRFVRNCVLPGAVLLSMGGGGGVVGQEAAAEPAAPPPPAPWGARCASAARTTAPDCVIEQRVVLSNSGQLLAAVTIRLPPDSSTPVMMIQTPFGLNLPAGLKLAIDEKPFDTLPLQTCDGGGCYAGNVVSPELLSALKQGTTLSITFQDQAQRDIAVPVSLNGFTAAYEKIQ